MIALREIIHKRKSIANITIIISILTDSFVPTPKTEHTPINPPGNRNDYIFFKTASRQTRGACAGSKFEFEIGT